MAGLAESVKLNERLLNAILSITSFRKNPLLQSEDFFQNP